MTLEENKKFLKIYGGRAESRSARTADLYLRERQKRTAYLHQLPHPWPLQHFARCDLSAQ